ncbi:hypothetical protein [Glycomyces arizonensis]|uniref:hypothetical protein n=1 Tax=Glycomyces arizonensis TaxID=256035 RepID=UPI0004005845|nr:hypothetical protein [Glycomyces arizonensis]
MALPDPTLVSGPVGARLQIPTPLDGIDGQATHPAVAYSPDMLGGYPYWMAMTPYPGSDDSYEDPCIVASFDGVHWVVPAGVSNPIDDQPGSPGAYNSDPDLKYYNGALHLFWRTYDGSGAAEGAEEKIYYSTSIDGRTWTPKVLVYSSDHHVLRLLSPCFALEDGAWVMWAVDIVPSPYRVVRLQGTADPAGPWGDPAGVDMGPMQPDRQPWHLGITPVDGGYVGLINDRLIGGASGELVMVVSADGITWTNSGRTVVPRVQVGEHTALYRAVLLPEVDGIISGWRVWYGAFRTEADSIWHVYRTFINAPYVPEVPEAGPPIGRAVLRSVVEWIACDVTTGNKVAYLGVKGAISRALGAYTSSTLTIPAPLAGPLALGGLLDQAVGPDQLPTRMIVCIVNDLPQWAGLIWKVRGGTDATISLGCATPESYLDRRFIEDMAFDGVDQATLAASLIDAVNNEGINLEIDAPPTGVLRDREYFDDEDATFYQRLQELMDVDRGLEWTIDLDWKTPKQQAVRMIFRAAERLGSTVPRGPLATESEAVTRYEVTHDYGKGMGANDVLAYSSGEGVDRPQSQHLRNNLALAAGVPRVEHRWSPSSSIKDTATLNAHAASELARLDGGTTTLAVTSRWNIEPARLGIDLNLGDAVAYDLVGHMHPTGLRGTGRMVGYRLDPLAGTFEPVLRI